MALRAAVVTLVTHGGSALARDDDPLRMARETLERALAVDGVRDGRRRAVVGALSAARREHLGALLLGLRRNVGEDVGKTFGEAIERSCIQVRVRTSTLRAKLAIAWRWRRRDDVRSGAPAPGIALAGDPGEEADRSERERERPEDVHAPSRREERPARREVVGGVPHRSPGATLRFITFAAHFL